MKTSQRTDGPHTATNNPETWAAVIINYNSGPLLAQSVQSIVADTSSGETPEVVVVDNGSSDSSLQQLSVLYPDIRIIHSASNFGYARAANIGIAATSASIVVICNPDIEFDAGTAKVIMHRFQEESDIAAVGPMLVNPDGSWYPSARVVPSQAVAIGHAVLGWIWPTNPFTKKYRQLDMDPTLQRDAEWVSGACLWLRRIALDEVGGWDERYFMFVEDVDLCWRLRQKNWRVVYEPSGRVMHVRGASTSKRPYRMIIEHHRSTFRFASRRWHGAKRALLIPLAALLTVRAGGVIVQHAIQTERKT